MNFKSVLLLLWCASTINPTESRALPMLLSPKGAHGSQTNSKDTHTPKGAPTNSKNTHTVRNEKDLVKLNQDINQYNNAITAATVATTWLAVPLLAKSGKLGGNWDQNFNSYIDWPDSNFLDFTTPKLFNIWGIAFMVGGACAGHQIGCWLSKDNSNPQVAVAGDSKQTVKVVGHHHQETE